MPENYEQAAKAWAKRSVEHGCEIDRLHRALRKIQEHAEDGGRGSDSYAKDRLVQIRRVIATVLEI